MTERWTDETIDRFASTVATAIAANNEAIARIDERLEHFISRSDEQMEELTAVTQAIGRDVAQLVTTQQQSSLELNQAMIRLVNTQEGIAQLLSNLDEDRPTILRKLNAIENKVDSLSDAFGRILEREDRQAS